MRLPTIVIATALLAVAGPVASAHASDCTGADVAPTPATLGTAAVTTVCLLNEERAAAGRAPVALEMGLTTVAFEYARTMVREGYFGHVEPSGRSLPDRLAAIGYATEGAGENLSWGSGMLNTPAAMVKGWMESEEHRTNMLDPDYRRVGIGIALGAPAAGVQDAATYVADFDTGPADSQISSSPEPAAAESPGAPRSAVGAPSSVSPWRRSAAQVKRTVRSWMEAGRNGDAAAFCRLEDNKMLQAQTGKINDAGIAACKQVYRPNPGLPPASELVIRRVSVHGTKASLKLTVAGATARVELRKRNGHWKIDSVQA